MLNYKLIDDKGEQVKLGQSIIDSKGEIWEFAGFSRGRLGPKINVRTKTGTTREFFYNVFPLYQIVEDQVMAAMCSKRVITIEIEYEYLDATFSDTPSFWMLDKFVSGTKLVIDQLANKDIYKTSCRIVKSKDEPVINQYKI